MSQHFTYEMYLSFLEGAISAGTSASGASVDPRVSSLLQEAQRQIHHNAENPYLTPQDRDTSQFLTLSFYQQRLRALQAVLQHQTITPSTVPENSQDGSIIHEASEVVPMTPTRQRTTHSLSDLTTNQNPISNRSPSSSSVNQAWQPSPSRQPNQTRNPEQTWQLEQMQNFRADIVTNANLYAAVRPSGSLTNNFMHTRNNDSLASRQTTPYSLQTPRHRRRQSSQPNNEQGSAISATTSHRNAMSTSEIRYLCRVEDCASEFRRARDEKRHFKTVHSDCNYVCILCNRNFTRYDSLRRHLERSCNGSFRRRRR